jgi:hypothetical protein
MAFWNNSKSNPIGSNFPFRDCCSLIMEHEMNRKNTLNRVVAVTDFISKPLLVEQEDYKSPCWGFFFACALVSRINFMRLVKMIALGMNFGLYGMSWRFLWSFLLWLYVGYLLVHLTPA